MRPVRGRYEDITRHGAQARTVASAMVALACVISLGGSHSHAGVHRDFEPRFAVNARGDLQIIGNVSLSCSTERNPNRQFCEDARSGVEGRNNQFFMDHVDLDTNTGTFNSSAASLTLPAGTEVLWAGLYWGARLEAGKYGGSAAVDPARAGQILFRSEDSGYQAIDAQQLDRFGTTYSAFGDATGAVKSQAGGTTRRYWVANLQAATGGNRHGGWALVVVYKDPGEPLRNFTIFDGYADVRRRDPARMTVTGFRTPLTGEFTTRIGVVTFDGDSNLRGDRLLLDGVEIDHDVDRPAGRNLFDGSIGRLDARISDKVPDFVNQLGLDIDMLDVGARLKNGAGSAELAFTSRGDIYYPAVLTVVSEVYAPALSDAFVISVTDENGGNTLPGEALIYDIAFENNGRDPAAGLFVSVPLEPGTTFEPGSLEITADSAAPGNAGPQTDAPGDDLAELDRSRVVFRLGAGATHSEGGSMNHPGFPEPAGSADRAAVRFKVRVDGDITGFPTRITSRASIEFTGVSTGDALTASSNPVALDVVQPPLARIGVAKAILPESGPVDKLDGTHAFTFHIVVENSGETDLSGVALEEDLSKTFAGAAFELGNIDLQSTTDTLVLNRAYSGIAPEIGLLDRASVLPAGASASVTVELRVTPGDNPGPYSNPTIASGRTFFNLTYEDMSTAGPDPDADGDGDPGNDDAPTLVRFNTPPAAGDDEYTVPFGERLTIEVLGNDRDIDGDDLAVLSFDNPNPAEFGRLAHDGEGAFTYEAPSVAPEGLYGPFVFSYRIADPAGQTSTATVRLRPTARADVGVVQSVSADSAPVGSTVVFKVVARNFGARPRGQAAKTIITNRLTAGLSVVSAEASQGTYDPETGLWDVGVLAAGTRRAPEEATLEITALVNEDGDYASTAAITAYGVEDPNPGNDEAHVELVVKADEAT